MDILFHPFVRRAKVLYRKENIRFNLHHHTHLAENIIRWGCLWASSTFIPEGFNDQLVGMANGTQYVAEQMVETFLLRKAVRTHWVEWTHCLSKSCQIFYFFWTRENEISTPNSQYVLWCVIFNFPLIKLLVNIWYSILEEHHPDTRHRAYSFINTQHAICKNSSVI